MATLWGLTGVKDWAASQVPENYREGILFLYPNGSVPLTGLTSKMPSEKVDNYKYNWHTEMLPTQGGAFTATEIYADATLADGVKLGAGGSAAGTLWFVKVAEAIAAEFRPQHEVELRDQSHWDMTCVAKVLSVVKNGASSYIHIKLLEIDDNGASTDLRNADYIYVLGDMSPDAGTMPEAVNYQPVSIDNYTQTIRTSMALSRRAKLTHLRTGDAYQVEKRRKTLIHGIEIEKIFLRGVKSLNYGLNGEIETTTMGLIPCIKTYAAANCDDFTLNAAAAYSGKTWAQAGCDWLFAYLEQISRYGEKTKVGYAGSGALLGILNTAKLEAQINITTETKTFGIKVTRVELPFITLELYSHPLFSHNPADRNSIVIFEPAKLRYRFMTDTTFKPDAGEKTGGKNAIDGTYEEFLTDAGLEFHHPICFGLLNGVGLPNLIGA